MVLGPTTPSQYSSTYRRARGGARGGRPPGHSTGRSAEPNRPWSEEGTVGVGVGAPPGTGRVVMGAMGFSSVVGRAVRTASGHCGGATWPETCAPTLPRHQYLPRHRPTRAPVDAFRHGATGPGRRRRRRIGLGGLAQQDGPEPPEPVGDPEGGAERLLAPEVAEEGGPEPGVGGTEQQGHGGEGRRRRTRRAPPTRPPARPAAPCPAPGSGPR